MKGELGDEEAAMLVINFEGENWGGQSHGRKTRC